MVYYGALSKGCQRCRQRKIKCDQRKPDCMNCERSAAPCPGYRNLDDIIFRNESARIIRRSRRSEQASSAVGQCLASSASKASAIPAPNLEQKALARSSRETGIFKSLSWPIDDLGANFFFTKYAASEFPFAHTFHGWLVKSYYRPNSSHALRGAIEAVGMAGISNVYKAPHVSSKSKEQYCRALLAMKRALNDPVQAVADTTLMALVIFGLFETVNLESWERVKYWEVHVKAAIAVLELRGPEQFARERGGQLYIQIRSQIISWCIQQRLPVPPALVLSSYVFQASSLRDQWRQRKIATSGSICEISFRLVNLRAAIASGDITDARLICSTAQEIDKDLRNWARGSPSWVYATIHVTETATRSSFCGKRHEYPNVWIADAWNNWRIQRIMINQTICENELRCAVPEMGRIAASVAVIQQQSTDICISVPSFVDSPRMISLIEPLYIVSVEPLNAYCIRSFAIEQLQHINASIGVRQAGLLATSSLDSLLEASANTGYEAETAVAS